MLVFLHARRGLIRALGFYPNGHLDIFGNQTMRTSNLVVALALLFGLVISPCP